MTASELFNMLKGLISQLGPPSILQEREGGRREAGEVSREGGRCKHSIMGDTTENV